MSVRKRKWVTTKGVEKEAWLVDYVDQHGKRHAKTFTKKKDADAFAATTRVEVMGNLHVAERDTITVAEAGKLWHKRASRELEQGTALQYEQHLKLHIVPFIGNTKLSKVTVPFVRKFMDDLAAAGRSPAMVRGVRTSLGSIISEAQERGHVVRNAVREMSANRRGSASNDKRRKQKLRYGVDIPTVDEIKLIIDHAKGKYRPLLITAIFTGLRSSELRGLRWSDVDLEKKQLRVVQRADNFNAIGLPKSEAGQRTIPLAPMVVNTLKTWKLECPPGSLELVFPTLKRSRNESDEKEIGIDLHTNIVSRGLWPPQISAGITKQKLVRGSDRKPKLDKRGNEQYVTAAKYEGLHALRHWFASWCINSVADGGRGLQPKRVQELLGHSTIAMTLDTYGHLFPSNDDEAELARAEQALFAN